MNFKSSAEVLIYKRKHEIYDGERREGIFRLQGALFAPIDPHGDLRNQIMGLKLQTNNPFNHTYYSKYQQCTSSLL